jgi:hypothetical protein
MVDPAKNEPKARDNLREVLIAGFESDVGLPSRKRANRPRQGPAHPILTVRIAGAESFFVGVFASLAGGIAAGYFGTVGLETARKAVHDSLPWLLPQPISPAFFVLGAFLGAVIGIYVGCAMIAPGLDSRRYQGKRLGGKPRDHDDF